MDEFHADTRGCVRLEQTRREKLVVILADYDREGFDHVLDKVEAFVAEAEQRVLAQATTKIEDDCAMLLHGAYGDAAMHELGAALAGLAKGTSVPSCVWKFALHPGKPVMMPRQSFPLSVGQQNGQPFLWALVEPDSPREARDILVAGTGHGFTASWSRRFIGTITGVEGGIVLHVWDEDTSPQVTG